MALDDRIPPINKRPLVDDRPPCWLVIVVGLTLLLMFNFIVRATSTPIRAEPPSMLERRLDQLEQQEERRHGEVLVRIESLRRQMLRLHGKRWVK